MFHNHDRKWKILFGFVDGFLTAAAFSAAYELREHLPFNLLSCYHAVTALLSFCVVTWMASGYWLNVYARFDSVRIGRTTDAFRQTGCGVIALLVLASTAASSISAARSSPSLPC